MSTQSERIKSLILNSGKSYQELEKITGIKKSSLQRYASGTTAKIPLEVFEKLSEVFNVSQEYLTGREPNDNLVYHCPDDENPYEVKMRDAFDTLDIDGQKRAADMVVDFAKNGNSPDLVLTEGEKALIKLLRRVPAADQPIVIEKILSALDNQE